MRHTPALGPPTAGPAPPCSCCSLLPLDSDQMQSRSRPGCHQSPSWVRGEWSIATVSVFGCCRQRLLHSAHLSPEEMERLWEPEQTTMEVEENRGLAAELITNKTKRQERKRQELLALALGVKLGSKGTLLWKPIKLLASCPQITSPLVRRSALKDSPEKQCSYEKIHNFKVRGCLFNSKSVTKARREV